MLEQSVNNLQLALAANLRRLRIARHISLSELARVTRISKATLSGIENAHANPTVETLAAIAGALRVSFVELLEAIPAGEMRVVRATQSQPEQQDGCPPRRLLDEIAAGGPLKLSEIALEGGHAHQPDAQAAGSRAHLYVLQGKLIAGPIERITKLGVGDYASFPTDVPHLYETTRRPARALLLVHHPA